MTIEDAKKLIFAYACCGIGKCYLCPLVGNPTFTPCDGEKLKDIDEAVETVVRERENTRESPEAKEKQKPKKPTEISEEFGYFVCGSCGTAIYASDDLESHHYCLNCGQAVDWSKDDKEMEMKEEQEKETE